MDREDAQTTEEPTIAQVAAEHLAEVFGEHLYRRDDADREGIPRAVKSWPEGEAAVILLEDGSRLVATVRHETEPEGR